MNCRERVFKAIKFEGPDRIPVIHEYLPVVPLVKAYLKIGTEIISLTDDWGTQSQLMISPALWRRIFKPRTRKYSTFAMAPGLWSICTVTG